VCVECGHDLTRSYRRPGGTRLWIVAAILAIAAVGVGAGFAIGALTNDNQHKKAQRASASTAVPPPVPVPAPTTPPPATTTPAPGDTTATTPTTPTTPAPTPAPEPAPGAIASWPDGKTAYTVVLVSAKRRSQANSKAKEAQSRGIQGVGVLHSNDYSSLNPGYWVVFAGQFNSVGAARSKLDEYASNGFAQAYPRQIKK
jgi:cell division septation protein DedD